MFFFLLLVSISAGALERPFIISGFDDVLRQANNTGLVAVALKIFDEDKTFAGMPELYRCISQSESVPKFVLVSAISSLFEGRIDRFLNGGGFPARRLFLRNWLLEWSIENFKVLKIKEIIEGKPGRKFIVIFDNSEASRVLAQRLPQLFPGKIQAIYLRQVVEKDASSSAISFFTAFDIALAEHGAGRMTASETAEIGEAVLKEKKIQNLFPSYANCPRDYNPCSAATKDIEDICTKVRIHIDSLCRASGS